MIDKEDYVEPRCPLCLNKGERIPIFRVLEKLDSFLFKKDYLGAENLLNYWIAEAESCSDFGGKLSLLNEFIGMERKLSKEKEALNFCQKSLSLIDEGNICDSILIGTTYLNVATAYKAFNRVNDAIAFYCKAQDIYEKMLKDNDSRLSGLYNNKALALMEVKKYQDAEVLFNRAIEILQKNIDTQTEIAITYNNLADLVNLSSEGKDREKIIAYLSLSKKYFDLVNLEKRDFNYAYACEKCAPAFGYYGLTECMNELNKRSKEIYERA